MKICSLLAFGNPRKNTRCFSPEFLALEITVQQSNRNWIFWMLKLAWATLIVPSVILTKNREATGLLARVLSRGVVLSHPIINPFSVGLNVPEYLWLIVLFDTTP